MTLRQLLLINLALLCGSGIFFFLGHISSRAPSSTPQATNTAFSKPSLAESRWEFPIDLKASAHAKSERDGVATKPTSLLQDFSALRAQNRALDALSRTQGKADLDTAYSSLFRELSLPPDELETLKDLLVERQSVVMDALEIANAEGLRPLENPRAFRELLRNASADTVVQIEQLLGPGGYEIYRDYQESLPLRNSLEQLRRRLSYSPTPISADEISRVMARLRSTRSNSDDSERSVLTEVLGANAHEPISRADLEGLWDILNAPQLAALEKILSEQEAQLKLAREMGTNTP